jgi:TolA-binding protein
MNSFRAIPHAFILTALLLSTGSLKLAIAQREYERPSTTAGKPRKRATSSPAPKRAKPPVAANRPSTTSTSTTAKPNTVKRPSTTAQPAAPKTDAAKLPSQSSQPETAKPAPETKRVPNLALALRRAGESVMPGQRVQIPLTITNTGNQEDQFRLETDLPAEYQPAFSLSQGLTDTGLPILITPQLARGASIDVFLKLRVPETVTNGQQQRYFLRAVSQSDKEVLRVADGTLSVVATVLTVSSKVSEATVMPGDTFTQIISIRNPGGASARETRADFYFNPSFELVSANPSPINYDRSSRTAIWSLGDVRARDTRDIKVLLRVVPNALAATSSLGRGAVRTQSLSLGSNFDSPSITVGKVPRARIDSVSLGLTATPGDIMFIPFIIRNPGNSPDAYDLLIKAPNAPNATIYVDTNGDGQHQDSEPAISHTAQLDPQGGQFQVLLRALIPKGASDGQQYSYSVVATSQLSNRAASEANTVLRVATPRLRVRMERVIDRTRTEEHPVTAPMIRLAKFQQNSDTPSDAEQAIFTKGQNLYNQGNYEQAATVLQDVLKTYPNSIITDLALLWLGRSYMMLGKLKEAEQVGQRLRAIKETPFTEIYEGELETARTELQKGIRQSSTSISYRLILSNEGSGIAKNVAVSELLPEELELVTHSDPAIKVKDAPGGTKRYVWEVKELAPGGTAVLLTTIRFKDAPQANSPVQLRHALSYQDLNGNNYQSDEVAENLTGAKESKAAKPKSPATVQKKNFTLQITSNSAKESHVTIMSDSALNDYSAYRAGNRFYVVLKKAAAPPAPADLRGSGFEGVGIKSQGDDTVIVFRLQPGTQPSVRQNLNKLEVVFKTP